MADESRRIGPGPAAGIDGAARRLQSERQKRPGAGRVAQRPVDPGDVEAALRRLDQLLAVDRDGGGPLSGAPGRRGSYFDVVV